MNEIYNLEIKRNYKEFTYNHTFIKKKKTSYSRFKISKLTN